MGQKDCTCVGLHKEVKMYTYILDASKSVSKYVSFHVFDWRGKRDVLVKYNSGDLGFFNCIFLPVNLSLKNLTQKHGK